MDTTLDGIFETHIIFVFNIDTGFFALNPFRQWNERTSTSWIELILGTGDLGLVATSDLGSAVPYS